MKSLGFIAGIGLGSFLLFLIISIPASVITDLATPAGTQITGVTGSAWRGEARNIDLPGFRLGRTSWNIRPAALLLGRLSATVETQWPDGRASGDLTAGLSGKVSLTDFNASGPVAPIAQQMNLPPSGGQVLINIMDLQLVDRWPHTVIGEVRVENVPLTLMGVGSGPVGSYQVSFSAEAVSEDGTVIGEMKDLDGPLIINGNVTLSPPNNYVVAGRITSRVDAPPDLAQGLALLGPAGSDGSREFSIAGSL